MEKNELIKSICKAALNKKAEKVTVVNHRYRRRICYLQCGKQNPCARRVRQY